jgi:hypothetical protein
MKHALSKADTGKRNKKKTQGFESDLSSSSGNSDDSTPVQFCGPAKVSKDAKETMQECASEFLLFVTSEAQELSSQQNRRTLNAEDVLAAMKKLGFD